MARARLVSTSSTVPKAAEYRECATSTIVLFCATRTKLHDSARKFLKLVILRGPIFWLAVPSRAALLCKDPAMTIVESYLLVLISTKN